MSTQLEKNLYAKAKRDVENIQYMVDRAKDEPNKCFRGRPLSDWEAALKILKRDLAILPVPD
jgi:hypothetical protein